MADASLDGAFEIIHDNVSALGQCVDHLPAVISQFCQITKIRSPIQGVDLAH
jgi:hypothetical protein